MAGGLLMAPLEELCPRCQGEFPAHYHCHECKGLGWVPTQEGESLLAFLYRRGFVQARER